MLGMMRVATLTCAVAVLALGCQNGESGGSGQKLSTIQVRIVGGKAETGFWAVGALMEDGEAFCTGTLIDTTTVVTASHCIAGRTSAEGLSFYVGPKAGDASGTLVPVASVHAHPQYDDQELTADIAVLKLTQAAPVTPIPPLKTSMDATWIGKNAVFVGYGVTGALKSDAGAKRSVSIAISGVDPTSFRYESPNKNTCFGDSGGPALFEKDGAFYLIGVTSYGDEDCAAYGVNTRVDPYISFIESVGGNTDAAAAAAAGSVSGGSGSEPGATAGDEPSDADGGDYCEELGWYGDGICDPDCANPDSDCEGVDVDNAPDGSESPDFCEEMGWYSDGICDIGCAQPDSDCEGMDFDDGFDDGQLDQGDLGDDQGADDEGDWGDDQGDLGDGPGGGDYCEEQGWYGDGICDEDCAQPDPDC